MKQEDFYKIVKDLPEIDSVKIGKLESLIALLVTSFIALVYGIGGFLLITANTILAN